MNDINNSHINNSMTFVFSLKFPTTYSTIRINRLWWVFCKKSCIKLITCLSTLYLATRWVLRVIKNIITFWEREVRIATSRAQGANCRQTNKGFSRDARNYTEAEEGCKFSGKTLPRVTREWGNSVIITRKERRLLGIAREKSQTTRQSASLRTAVSHSKKVRDTEKKADASQTAQVNLPNCRCINQRS